MFLIADFASFGVSEGSFSSIKARAPEATAAAIDVPPMRKYCSSTTQVEHIDVIALRVESVDVMCAPGARKSGLTWPS